MLVFESDRDDLQTAAGGVYLGLEMVLADKEAELRELDACILEEELELSR